VENRELKKGWEGYFYISQYDVASWRVHSKEGRTSCEIDKICIHSHLTVRVAAIVELNQNFGRH